jgi:hypothetical protein
MVARTASWPTKDHIIYILQIIMYLCLESQPIHGCSDAIVIRQVLNWTNSRHCRASVIDVLQCNLAHIFSSYFLQNVYQTEYHLQYTKQKYGSYFNIPTREKLANVHPRIITSHFYRIMILHLELLGF